MKIGILTQPLRNNYGGLLQAYALQATLKKMGHEAWIIRRIPANKTIIWKFGSKFKKIILKYLFGKKSIPYPFKKNATITQNENNIISSFTSLFVKEYINPVTELIESNRKFKKVTKEDYNAFIVGSDQVWRLKYSPNILNFYLDFAVLYKNIKRVAYAASFGVGEWHYSKRLTKKCKYLANKFDAISVRENSAVKLCKEHLNVNVEHLVDPTLLLTKDDYLELIDEESEHDNKAILFYYILDNSKEIEDLIKAYSQKLNLEPFTVMPAQSFSIETRSQIKNCIYPSVEKWLNGFNDAKFVITDSFHGCIFSILFNIPFVALGNIKRGLTRFDSLLELFDLYDRLVLADDILSHEIITESIDWNKVNEKVEKEKMKALLFLKENLANSNNAI